MKFDPARFASIRAQAPATETVAKTDLEMLREITSAPCGIEITPALKAMAANTRAAIKAADDAKKPAQEKINPPNRKLTPEEIAEQRRLEDEAEAAAMEKNFAQTQPNTAATDFNFEVTEDARKNAAANVARLKTGFKLTPKPEGETL